MDVDRGRRLRVAAVSAGFHLLLLLVLIGGMFSVSSGETVPVMAEEQRPILTFEAPPLEEEPPPPLPEPLVAEAVPPEPGDAEPEPPPARPDAAMLQIPRAMVATPSTGFQNDLPFSDGQDEEFYVDQPMGREEGIETPPDPVVSSEEATPELPGEPTPLPGLQADAARPEPGEFPHPGFDRDAFRERIADPAGDARRRADAVARAAARARAEEADRHRRGTPTDIWRFLEGKRFRNPEGGLVSNRNNTLYYDDRGADLVPWIGRLIAEVRRNWYVPYAAAFQAGHVAIAISVVRSGALEWMQVVIPSGTAGFDNAAVGALRGAELLPLPDDYPGRNFEIMLVFWYNEQPYDLFGAAP